MGNMNISRAQVSTTGETFDEFTIDPLAMESPTGQKEQGYQNSNFDSQWGYFNRVPDLKTAILQKAVWIVGKGYTCDAATKVTLDHINGNGKDTFDDIIFNMEVIKRVAGDAYAEIVWESDKREQIVNLIPLNPKNIKLIVNEWGQIERYEQWNGKDPVKKFDPRDIFHLCHNRLGDQIHGISDIDAVESTIKAQEKNFTNAERAAELASHPFFIFKIKTDDTTKLDATTQNIKDALNKGTFALVPDSDGELTMDPPVQINASSTVFEFENLVRNRFFRSIGLPQIIPGSGGLSNESESKVIYLAFEQINEKDQRYLEKQIWNQLFLDIDFNSPATMAAALQSDTKKDGPQQQLNFQPSDVQAGVGR